MKLKSVKAWWENQLAEMARRGQPYREKSKIILHDLGFELIDANGNPYPLMWTQISCINAFKRDLFSYDLICFEFQIADKKLVLEVNEEMDGFDLLVKALPDRFEDFDTEWFSKVFQPAFATNFTEIWRRKETVIQA